jgi:hypothetical protein
MSFPNIKKMNDSIDPKSNPLHPTNNWNDGINDEVNDLPLAILVTNIIIIKHYLILPFRNVMYQTKNHKLQMMKMSQNLHILC